MQKIEQRSLEILNQQVFSWHLELSSKCALSCLRCARVEYPGQYKITEMNLEFIKKVFSEKSLLPLAKKILLSGGQGDAIYCKDFIKIIKYFKTTNPNLQLVITTNGSYKNENWWKNTASILNSNDMVIFSIDGWDQESNEKYRVNSHFDSILNGMKTLRKFNDQVYIMWTTIVFRFNQYKLHDIQELARQTGADAFNLVLSSLFGSRYPDYIDLRLGYDPLEPDAKLISSYEASDRGLLIKFSKEKYPKSIKPTINQFIDNYKSTYKNSYVMPMCRIGERGLYIDAEGILYPCSWVSHPFSIQKSERRNKTIEWKKSLWVEYKEKFNLHNHSLEEVLESSLWKKLFQSWFSSKTAFVECENKCHWSQSAVRLARMRLKKPQANLNEPNITKIASQYQKNIKKEAREILTKFQHE